MQLRSIIVRGFRSFVDQTKWVPPEQSGLYLLTGENKVDPQMTSNAIGKSSLIEALVWCLYGKTTRGLRACDVVSWGGDGKVLVEVAFTQRSTTHVLRRTIKPNRLMLDGAAVDQDKVLQAVGVNYECFLFSAVVGQFAKYFLDLGPTEKLNLFSFVLNLDFWVAASDRAKQAQAERDAAAIALDRQYAAAEARREEIKDQLSLLEVDIRKYETDRIGRRKVLDKRLVGLRRTKASLRAILDDTRRGREKHRRALARLTAGREDVSGDVESATEALASVRSEAAVFMGRIRGILGDMEEVRSAAPLCAKCHQQVSKKHIREEILRLRKKCNVWRAKRKAADDRELEEEDKVIQSKAALREFDQQLSDKQLLLQAEDAKVRKCESDIKSVESEIDDVEDELTTLRKAANPYSAQYDRSIDAKRGLNDEMKGVWSKIRVARQQASDKKAWVRLFRELRIWLIEEVLAELHVETANVLAALGLHGWSMEFDVERVTLAGAVQRGLQVLIVPPGREEPVKFESYSGGETQRLRVAGSISMINLIARRRGVDLGFLIVDEPTMGLNAGGIDDLLQFFRDYSRTENKVVILADQHVLDAGDFDGVVRLVKDDNGSKLDE